MWTSKTQNVSEVIDILKPCRVTYTSNSVYVATKDKQFVFTSNGTALKPKELQFVKKFRAYFNNNKPNKFNKRYANHQPKFFRFYKDSGNYSNIIEIDINKAYPSSGKILGIIPDFLYEEGINHSKSAFLVAIGSLFRKKKVIDVASNGERTLVKDEKPDPYLSSVWRSIVGFVDHAMQSSISTKQDAVYFYWCDALFVKKSEAQHFIDQLNSFGFEVKTKDIERIEYQEDKALVHYVGVSEPKSFSKPVRRYTVSSIDQLIKKYEQKKK